MNAKPKAVEEKRKDKIPYEYYREQFCKFDLNDILKNPGVVYDGTSNEITVDLLGQEHRVSLSTGEVDKGKDNIKYSLKTLILRYLMACKDIKPSEEMINYRDIKDGNLYYNNFYGRCILRLGKTFNGKLDKLQLAMEKLGAEKLNLGDMSFKVKFLHNIYVYVIMWKEDEEFPASAQILFSDNVGEYFSAEDLAFVGDALNDKLVSLAYAN